MEPVPAILIPNLTVLAGNKPAGVRQCPVKVLIAANVDGSLARNCKRNRTAIRQASFVFNLQTKSHGTFSRSRRRRLPQPSGCHPQSTRTVWRRGPPRATALAPSAARLDRARAECGRFRRTRYFRQTNPGKRKPGRCYPHITLITQRERLATLQFLGFFNPSLRKS